MLPEDSAVSTVVHELAHQWFGDSVSISGWRDIWLNEGAARFMEWVYAADQGGGSTARRLRTTYEAHPADDPFWSLRIEDPGSVNLFEPPIYDRGAMTLAALQQRLDGKIFWRVMRTWLRDNEGGSATTAEFMALAESVSGEDLSGFFEAWLTIPARPADSSANGLG